MTDEQFDELLLEQQANWQSERRDCVEEFVEGRVDLRLTEDQWLSLICQEVVLREASGESPALAEYVARFPHLADALRIQWEMDRMLGMNTSVAPTSTSSADSLDTVSFRVKDDSAGGLRNGRYELGAELGRGANGVVYKAWDTTLKRTVALKRLRAGFDAHPEELVRIRSEAEAIAKVQHPQIVQVFDVGVSQGLPYLAMEYCEGGTLANRLNGCPLSPKLAAELVLRIARGLLAAHERRIIHRDLKPGNVLLERPGDWTPKISDFGLAKMLDADSAATATGAILGTPAYMAPEQAFGDAKRAAPTADIYSLGAILYECLTGRPPFRGVNVAETLDQVKHCDPASIRQLEPKIPIDLETIVHKCLRKEPGQRYSTANELIEDLSRFLDQRSILARRERWYETAARVGKKHPVAASLAATAFALLLVVAVGSTIFAGYLREALLKAEEASREAKLKQAEALVGRAHGIRLSRRPGQRFEALSAIRQAVEIGQELGQPTSWYDPIRDEAIAALLLPDAHVERWQTDAQMVEYADYSDDCRILAISRQNVDDIELRALADHAEVGRIPKPGKSASVRFVGSDRLLLMSQSNSVEMWDISGLATQGTPPRQVWQLDRACSFIDISPDRQRLVIVDDREMSVVDAPTGAVLSRLRNQPFTRECRVAIHPTLPIVAMYSYFQPIVELRNWATGESLQDLHPGEGRNDYPGYLGADWSPDGRRLFVVNAHSDAQHWYELDSISRRLKLARTDSPARMRAGGGAAVRFNASGDRIFHFGWANQLGILDANTSLPVIESLPARDRVICGPRSDAVFSFGGYFGHPTDFRQSGIISIADAREARTLISGELQCGGGVALDPTGRMLLGVVPDGLLFVEFPTGRHLLTLPLNDVAVVSFAFDQQGNFLLNGATGCYRWPYRLGNAGGLSLELGVPKKVHVPYGNVQIACSADGQTVAASAWNGFGTQEYAGFWIQTPGEPAARKLFGGLTSSHCAVSPSGTLVAALHDSGQTILFECQGDITRKHEYRGVERPLASQDGKWFLFAGRRYMTDTWQPDALLSKEGAVTSLTSDGSWFLTQRGDGVIGLGNAVTGVVQARFEWKNSAHESPPYFSPDGQHIVFWSKGDVVTIDVPRVRSGLEDLGLDWESRQQGFRTPSNSPPRQERGAEHRRSAGDASDTTEQNEGSLARVELAPELASIHTIDELSDLVDELALARSLSEPNNPYAAFDASMVAIDRRDFTQALVNLNRCCELLPQAITPRMWRGYLFAAMRDYKRAIEDANWIIDRKGASVADLEQFAKRPTDANSQFVVPATFEAPIEEDFRLLRAEWHYRAEQYEAAIADCSQLIQHGGNRWAQYAYGLRAACYEAKKDLEKAKADQSKFLALTHLDPKTLNMVAGHMSGRDISLRQPTIALRLVRKLQSLGVELDEHLVTTIGCVLFQNDLFDETTQWIERHRKQGKGEIDGFDLYLLALAYQRLGKTEIAQQCAGRADVWRPVQPLDYRDRRDLEALRYEWRKVSSETREVGSQEVQEARGHSHVPAGIWGLQVPRNAPAAGR